MTLLDVDVPLAFGFVSQIGLEIAGVIAIISLVTYQVLIVVLPLLLVVRWLQVIIYYFFLIRPFYFIPIRSWYCLVVLMS